MHQIYSCYTSCHFAGPCLKHSCETVLESEDIQYCRLPHVPPYSTSALTRNFPCNLSLVIVLCAMLFTSNTSWCVCMCVCELQITVLCNSLVGLCVLVCRCSTAQLQLRSFIVDNAVLTLTLSFMCS